MTHEICDACECVSHCKKNGCVPMVALPACDRAGEECTMPREVVQSGWMPIDTAPKDGSMFLCWVDAERWSALDGEGSGIAHDVSQIDLCRWSSVAESPNEGYFDNASGQVGDDQGVTHWMPLPAAPTALAQTKEQQHG